jgi:hypothetical protein
MRRRRGAIIEFSTGTRFSNITLNFQENSLGELQRHSSVGSNVMSFDDKFIISEFAGGAEIDVECL